MEHPLTGDKFDEHAKVWRVIVEYVPFKTKGKGPTKFLSYPARGCPLYTFAEAAEVLARFEKRTLSQWIESETMRMDEIAAKDCLEVLHAKTS